MGLLSEVGLRISRTKLLALAIIVLQGLQSTGLIHLPDETLKAILALLAGGGLWGLRDAISRNGNGK